MELKKEFALREVAGEHLLVPIGRTSLEMNGILALNESGVFLWNRLPQAADEAALLEALLAEYEVDRPTAEQDVAEFLQRLRKFEIID